MRWGWVIRGFAVCVGQGVGMPHGQVGAKNTSGVVMVGITTNERVFRSKMVCTVQSV